MKKMLARKTAHRRIAFLTLIILLSTIIFQPNLLQTSVRANENALNTSLLVSPNIVISQVYGGNGNTFASDYVELFNRGTSNASLSGYTVQYASATGTGNFAVAATLSGTLAPGQYYLVKLMTSATGTAVTGDATGSTNISATAGKAIVANSTTAIACNGGSTACSAAQQALIIDLVGYGSANFFEGAATPAPSSTTAIFRAENGCTDTDNNSTNFSTGTPAPRNTSTALSPCAGASPTISINDVSVTEGNAGTVTAAFTVTLSQAAPAGGVSFTAATADNTATVADSDYAALPATSFTILEGATTTTVNVTVNGDTNSEGNESFFVNLSNPPAGVIIGDGQGVGTITNDDAVFVTPIHQIQGSGATSPLVGQTNITTTGIVTLLRTSVNTGAGSAASGFFLQTPDASADADPNTSQGIFVFTTSVPTVAVGDSIQITGNVVEFNGLTEINAVSNVTIINSGNVLPTAVVLDSTILDPTAATTKPQLEKYEGMRLSAASLKTVVPNDSFYDVRTVLGSVPREQVFREPGIPITATVPPDPTSGTVDVNIARFDENPERLTVDTNGRAGAANQFFTSNVTFTNPAGPLDYAFGEYRLVLDAAPNASANMSATPVRAPLASEFTVASYNIEFFNRTKTVQLDKASQTIRNILRYPDVLGLIEIDDLADAQALADDVNAKAIAAGDPNPQYTAYLQEGNSTSGEVDQNVAFLVKTARVSVTSVTQERKTETFVNPVSGATESLHDRPPFVLRGTVNVSGFNPQSVIVVVNHLRSFIDIEMVAGDGVRVRAKRKAQAESLAGLLQELQTNNPNVPVISVGDYNAFQFSSGYDDSISVIKGTPTADDQIVVDQSPDLVNPNFINAIDNVPADQRYTFVFENTPQILDHVLVNQAASLRLRGTEIAHVNSDYPETPTSAFENNAARPERNSDHDPVISYFTVATQTAASANIAGRVTTAMGRGIPRVTISLTNSATGEVRYAQTSANGNYRFRDVSVGDGWIVSAAGKRYDFAPGTRYLNLLETNENVNFTAVNR